MEWEFAVLDWLQTLRTPFLDDFFVGVTHIGDGGLFWIALGVLLLLFRKTRVCGMCVLASLALGALVTNVTLKPLVARPRPFWVRDTVKLLIAAPQDYSFPSGHTQASFAAATAIWKNSRRWGALALAVAALVAISRLYLYVHFPTDVLFGALIGICVGNGMAVLVKKRIAPHFSSCP